MIDYTSLIMRGVWVCAIMVLASCGNTPAPSAQASVEPANHQSRAPRPGEITVHADRVTGTDDVARLQHLASGVGWEFSPNAQTTAELKRIGIKTIRCINVDPLVGVFGPDGKFVVGNPTRLLQHFETCRAVGAIPHICIAIGLPDYLRLTEEDLPAAQRGLMGNQMKTSAFGPTDWGKFRALYKALFKYVLVDQNFPNARFEVGNEPDIGCLFVPRPPKPANGSAAAYDAYLNIYRNVAQAAVEFERENPKHKVILGGPALAWAYTFKFGDFNWSERFIKDVAEQKLKCDFIGLHVYGNISSQYGEFPSKPYPTFTEMLKVVNTARARYLPGKPIWITEWGPSYQTSNSPAARINADHLRAAWSAAVLATMLRERIDGALFLVTTDHLQPTAAGGTMENVWGWPALFVNPETCGGKTYPKAIFHVLDMVSRLRGKRVAVETPEKSPGVFSCVDPKSGTVKTLFWNYDVIIPETAPATDRSTAQPVQIRIFGLPKTLADKPLTIRRWQVSEKEGNAVMLNDKGISLTAENTALPQVEEVHVQSRQGEVSYTFTIPPSGVSLVEISAEAKKP